MTRSTTPKVYDKRGFELRSCTRCGGSGRYSYCQQYGDRCFGCGGTGWQHTPKAAKQYSAWLAAWKAACQPTWQNVKVGDEVRDYHAATDAPFSTVTAMTELVGTDDEGWAGKSLRDGVMVVTSWHWMVTVDGVERKVSGNMLVRRKATVLATDFGAASREVRQAALAARKAKESA